MEKANSLFLLSGVKDHIVANCNMQGGSAVFFAQHEEGEQYPSISLTVSKCPGGFTVSYRASTEGGTVDQGSSDPVPPRLFPSYLSAIINDSIPL